jgi:hypothetical protein
VSRRQWQCSLFQAPGQGRVAAAINYHAPPRDRPRAPPANVASIPDSNGDAKLSPPTPRSGGAYTGKEVLVLQKVAIKEQPDAVQPPPTSSIGDAGAEANKVMNNHAQTGQMGLAEQTAAGQLGPGSGIGPMASQTAGAANQAASMQPSVGQPAAAAAGLAPASQVTSCALKYMVVAGTAEKMLGE